MPANILSTGVEYPITTSTGSTRTSGKWATRAIFGFGTSSAAINTLLLNLVNNYGIVATDTSGVYPRTSLAAASYGGDKAIFGFGEYYNDPTESTDVTNLVSNLGVISS
jgi:hypothetical protein